MELNASVSAVVTGGASGLGAATARALAAHGVRVALFDLNAEKGEALARELGGVFCQVNVTSEAEVEVGFASARAAIGQERILVNCAGLFRGGSILTLSAEDWNAVVGTHLTGAFFCAKHAARAMIARGDGGKIINLGSVYSRFGPPDFADYATAKTGILGLTRALAVELAVHRVQVNAILPGWFDTELTLQARQEIPGLHERVLSRIPFGHWGKPDDMAGTAIWLASPASDYITGVAIPVDGGYTAAL